MNGCLIFQEKSTIPNGCVLPVPFLLKRHVRQNKTEPLIDQEELLQANPQYAHIWYSDGRESTVSIRHLAPMGEEIKQESLNVFNEEIEPNDANHATSILGAHSQIVTFKIMTLFLCKDQHAYDVLLVEWDSAGGEWYETLEHYFFHLCKIEDLYIW
jgi:hypothetical protein